MSTKPVFTYTSACCGASATKPPCEKVRSTGKKRKGETEFSSLGHWSCSNCGKGCKVTRSKRKQEESSVN